jgi:hypothetical protein
MDAMAALNKCTYDIERQLWATEGAGCETVLEGQQLDAHADRLRLILKPFPLVDAYKNMPATRIQTRIWAGIITNPGGPWGVPERGRKKSAYYNADDDYSYSGRH